MPTNTPNLNLIKPLVSEHYDVVVANANNDILDSAVGDVYTKSEVDGLVADKQDALVSGTNIKTINGATILDSGDLELAPQATTYTKGEVDAQVGLLAPKADPTFTGTQTLPNIVTNGIKFPAVQVPSSDPNTLDDYEEGTFTPTVYGLTTAGTGQTYSAQVGKYIKIGQNVQVWGRVTVSNKGTGTGGIAIGGLPFSVNTPARIKASLATLYNVTGKTLSDTLGAYISGTINPPAITVADANGNALDYSVATNVTSIDFFASYPVD